MKFAEYNAVDVKERIRNEIIKNGYIPYKFLPSIGLAASTLDKANKSMPKADNLARIADALFVSVDYLLGREERAVPASAEPISKVEKTILYYFNSISPENQNYILKTLRMCYDAERMENGEKKDVVLV